MTPKRCVIPILLTLLLTSALPAALGKEAEPRPPSLEEAEQLFAGLEEEREQIRIREEAQQQFEGDDLEAVEMELADRRLHALSGLHALVRGIVELQRQGVDVSSLRKRVEPPMQDAPVGMRRLADSAMKRGAALRARREGASPQELVELEYRIAKEEDQINRLSRAYLDHIGVMEILGLDATAQREWLSVAASVRAEFLSRRMEITLERQSFIKDQLKTTPGDVALARELSAVKKRLESDIGSLRTFAQAMTSLGLDATRYNKLILMTTGRITDIGEPGAVLGLIKTLIDRSGEWLATNGIRLGFATILFLLILSVSWGFSRIARPLLRRTLASSRFPVSRLLEELLTRMASQAIFGVGVLVVLSLAGVQFTALLTGLGVAGFIVGFALQGVLSNFASGVMILFYRPFDLGDLVEVCGVEGKVHRMTLVSTTILTLDNQTLVVPNTKIWGDVIRNVTAQATRRVDMTFGISYEDDIPRAEKVLVGIVRSHPKVLADPAPIVKLHALRDSSVDFIVRPWARTEDYWDVYWEVTREVKLRFDAEGLRIPFPQRDVHLHMAKSPQA